MQATIPSDKLGLVLKIGLFAFFAYIGLAIFYNLLTFAGVLIAGALGTFLAAAVANAITVRIFERGRLSDMGLGWDDNSLRNVTFGVCAGILAAAVFIGPALVAGAAVFERDQEFRSSFPSFVFLTTLLVF